MACKPDQGEMVVGKIGRQYKFGLKRQVMFAEEMAEPEMIVGEERQNLLLGIEHLQA